MRVIAGSAGGLTLQAPGRGTRPTMDRVRAAIFSSLGERVPEASVLDLFSGSGALGIEALSRGARSAVFVEQEASTAALIRRNLAATKLSGSVQNMDVFRFLKLYGEEGGFDLIFADPPYAGGEAGRDANLAETLLADAKLRTCLHADGLLVLECGRRQPLPSLPDWRTRSDRSYGESRILILSPLS